MRNLVWLIFLCVALAASAWASNKVDAEQVAKEHKASFHWFPVQKTFLLAGEGDTLKFAIGLPYVSSHGNSIELKHAPEITDGHILLDSADVASLYKTDKTAPVAPASSSSAAKVSSSSAKVAAVPATPATTAAKPKNETAGTREVKTIVIDPGHGGKDTGAQGKNSNEKDIVLAVGKLLKKALEKEGFNVKMTRDKDVFIELGERANLANQWDGDLFISLHCNAIDATPERKKQIKGYHVYVLRAPESEEDKAIARRENKVATLYGEKNAKEELSPLEWFKLEARLEKYKQNSYMFTEEMLKAFDGGKIKRQGGGVGGAGFMVLVGALMPAVLFEIGFISNPEEETYMTTTKAQEDIAARVAKAVSTYKAAVHNYRETLGR
ncbi:N-acetylmuramoyl-L-alanine amidase [uncultured Fibrobacter sp.]|uniref:N-acetylmuramoyl-L-alanine amidase family protein n=1 Tax=uncultured Fibrobacter sp. TaxID=261512 RepID=UPI00260E1E26|nr:N-acetylmuramoyl-L-alanine amidase [uncultured Fibrobacter sp.]